MRQLVIRVHGRPAPQGSKDGDGQEASLYLPAWRAAVKRDALQAMLDNGRPALPMFAARLPVHVLLCRFYVPWAPTAKPDVDKLLRSTLDALGGAKDSAHVFADDSQVVAIDGLRKERSSDGEGPGVLLVIREIV